MMTTEDLRALCPKAPAAILSALSEASGVLDDYGINTPLRRCHFWAQAAHESGGLKFLYEIWGPTEAQKKYEGRRDLGNLSPGDGRRYRGRGIFQLTGRANYEAMSKRIGENLVEEPDKAAEPAIALRIACEYWVKHRLNELADKDDILGITKRINGGTNGLLSRKSYLEQAKKLWLEEDEVKAPKAMTESKQGNGAVAVGLLGSVGAVKEVVSQAQEANDLLTTVLALAGNTQFLMMATIVGLGALIWYWRFRHMQEHGV